MRGHVLISRSLALVAMLVMLLVGAASMAAAETVPGGYTGGESTQGSVDDNPDPPDVVPAAPALPSSPSAARLAFTGGDVVIPLAVLGAALLLIGSVAVTVTRTRRDPSAAT